ncbi:putative leader peptide [Streptomyces sp. GMY02]|nr:putative leader peptide [Streptomyces sp. GMY02]
MRGAPQRPMVTIAMYSRRHIDLQRVAAALCPAYESVAARHSAA